MSAVTKVEGTLPQVQDMGAAILAVIERAARDQSVDIDKMERLLAMQERVHARNAEAEFNIAMNAAQSEMRPISADANNPQTRSKYATFAKLDSALRPIYTRHGFSLSYDEGDSPKPEHVRVLCYVAHVGGHTRTYHRDMPADGKGAKGGDVMTKTHAAGAAGSYGARYLLKGIFNVAVGEDDRDGNTVDSGPVSEDQFRKLQHEVDATNANLQAFCKLFGVMSLKELPASRFDEAMAKFATKRRQMGAAK